MQRDTEEKGITSSCKSKYGTVASTTRERGRTKAGVRRRTERARAKSKAKERVRESVCGAATATKSFFVRVCEADRQLREGGMITGRRRACRLP